MASLGNPKDTGTDNPTSAGWSDFWFLVVVFACLAALFLVCGSALDGSLVAWLMTLRLPAGW